MIVHLFLSCQRIRFKSNQGCDCLSANNVTANNSINNSTKPTHVANSGPLATGKMLEAHLYMCMPGFASPVCIASSLLFPTRMFKHHRLRGGSMELSLVAPTWSRPRDSRRGEEVTVGSNCCWIVKFLERLSFERSSFSSCRCFDSCSICAMCELVTLCA